MRFLVQEQRYERPLMAGKYEYLLAGVPTGAVESWRLTAVAEPEQYQILRVDLDGRASSGHTYLYHALLDGDGLVSRLLYRFWTTKGGWRIHGDVQRAGHTAVCTHTHNQQTASQELTLPDERFPLWFPSVIGLHLAAEGAGVTLHGRVTDPDALTPHLAEVQIRQLADQREIRWRDMADEAQMRTIWPEAQTGWPTKMARVVGDDGGELTAVVTSWQVYR